MSNLLGACRLIITVSVPQSPPLYHEGVDSILMGWNGILFCNPIFPCFPKLPRPSPIPRGLDVDCQTDRQTDRQLG